VHLQIRQGEGKVDEAEILIETSPDGVATVTINRPGAMNSFTRSMCEGFERLWRGLAEDEAIRAVVLRAAPGRAFSTGLDVKNGAGIMGSDNVWNQRDPGELLGPKQNRCWKPVIAAVHGLCAGGAFYWLNEADIILCSEDAQFFDPHVTYGLTAALEPIGLRWRIPLGEVLRMTLLGNDERIGAETALRIGLVSEITAADQLWTRAHSLAAAIAAKPAAATQGSVRAIWESMEVGRSAALAAGLKYCQVGNPIGVPQVDRAALMKQPKNFTVR
jgi:enoyl-CoA hydratase/carnithine racemase